MDFLSRERHFTKTRGATIIRFELKEMNGRLLSRQVKVRMSGWL